MIKFCAIGCGGHASDVHGPSQQQVASQLSGVELSACCDLSEANALRYRDQFGFARSYTDINTMLEAEQPDAVSLVVPTTATCELAIPLLERGLPLFLEKPPGLTVEEINRMIVAMKQGGAVNHVAFNRRFMPVMVKLREVYLREFESESIVNIHYVMNRENRSEDHFWTTAVHAIDALLYLANSPYAYIQLSYQKLTKFGSGVANYALEGTFENGVNFRLDIQPITGKVEEGLTINALDKSIKVDLLGPELNFMGHYEYWHNGSLADQYSSSGSLIERNGIFDETLFFFNSILGKSDEPMLALDQCIQQVTIMQAMRDRESEIHFNNSKSRILSAS
jgi:hypothetical protein